jgi:hypothetical protein
MKTGPELAGWLADRERQGKLIADADAAALRWADHPLYTGMTAELAAMDAKTPPLVMAATERFMDGIDDIEAMLREFIACATADPFFSPRLATVTTEIHTGYLLYADPAVTISLGVIGADALAAKKLGAEGTTALSFTGLLTSYRFLKAGGATMSFWEALAIDGDFSADMRRSCRFVERRRIEDGERLVMDGRCQSLVIEHLQSDMLCLQASVQVEAAPLVVDYDSRTLKYLGATSTDEASSRTQMMVTLLRLMDRVDAVPVIKEALDSPHFYTRWQVMRELLALDADAALPSLRRMAAKDPHPEVRFAATQTLALFFDEEPEEMLLCRA